MDICADALRALGRRPRPTTAIASPRPSGSSRSRSSATRIQSARDYAVNLGLAFQLTNILRDVAEDARARAASTCRARTSSASGAGGRRARRPLREPFRLLMAARVLRGRRVLRRARFSLAEEDRQSLAPPRRCGSSTSSSSAASCSAGTTCSARGAAHAALRRRRSRSRPGRGRTSRSSTASA